MQVDTTTLAEVGTVYRQTAGEEPGDDFALIKIYPEVAAKWGVNPAIPTGGPQGIYAGCDPQVVKNYGHGYGVAVGQGKPEAGVATDWYSDGYGWYGVGIMGDSGSGITMPGQPLGRQLHPHHRGRPVARSTSRVSWRACAPRGSSSSSAPAGRRSTPTARCRARPTRPARRQGY